MVSICRDELDRLKGCAFVAHCSRETQELHHRLRIRGRACCFYVMMANKTGITPTLEREGPPAAIPPRKVFGYDD